MLRRLQAADTGSSNRFIRAVFTRLLPGASEASPASQNDKARQLNDRSIRRHVALGMMASVGLLGGVTSWAAVASISGAVIATGQIVVAGSTKKVQHPEGGVVAQLLVREGQRVEAGEVLIRLDDTVLKANLAILVKSLDDQLAQEARLIAERDGLPEIEFPSSLLLRASDDSDVRGALSGQRQIFESRMVARETARSQLGEQVSQLEASIVGLLAQQEARETELALIAEELRGVRDLYAKNLVPLARLNALNRDRARIAGDRGKLLSEIASARGQIAEKRTEIARIDHDFRAEVVKDLADVRVKVNEVVEREVSARDRLARVELRAPVSGIVHQLNVFTIGGVVSAGEAVMQIVPANDNLQLEVNVEPQDIENIRMGQKAAVHFSAFHDRSIKDAVGEVMTISPDAVEDSATRRRFFKIKIQVSLPEAADGSALALVPGMPAEAFMIKSDRTVLEYLLRPMADQLRRVFRA